MTQFLHSQSDLADALTRLIATDARLAPVLDKAGQPDLRRGEAALLLPLVILMFVVGLVPNLILQPSDAAVEATLVHADENRIVLVDRGSD